MRRNDDTENDPFVLGHTGSALRHAILDGALVHVSDVPSGKGEGRLRCPECGRPVLARKGEVKSHHFAHLSEASRDGCGVETAAHLKAKDIIVTAGWIYAQSIVEAWSFDEFPSEKGWQVELFPWGKVRFASAAPEIVAGSRRVDVMAYDAIGAGGALVGAEMAVEVCVTHAVDDEKQDELDALGIPTLEVFLDPKVPVRESAFRDHVLRKAKRSWRVPPPTAKARAKAARDHRKRLEDLRKSRAEQIKRQECIDEFWRRSERAREKLLFSFGCEVAVRLQSATALALADLPAEADSPQAIERHFSEKSLLGEFRIVAPDWPAAEEARASFHYLARARLAGEGRIIDDPARGHALFHDLRGHLRRRGVDLGSVGSSLRDLSSQEEWKSFFEGDSELASAHVAVIVRAILGLDPGPRDGALADRARDVPAWLEAIGIDLSITSPALKEEADREMIGSYIAAVPLAEEVLEDDAVRNASEKLVARILGLGDAIAAQVGVSSRDDPQIQRTNLIMKVFRLDQGGWPPRTTDAALDALRAVWRRTMM